VENGKKIQVTLRPHVMEFLRAFAKEKGLSMSAVVALALDKLQKSEKGESDENGK
jgi:hypothetical protein